MGKPKLAFFSFASCEGCQLQVVNLEDCLLDVLGAVEIVNFREAIDDKRDDYDIAFLEGSITRPADREEVMEIRKHAKLCVSLGACACIGGINAMKNSHSMEACKNTVYQDKSYLIETFPTQRVADVINVDYEINGCPITTKELVDVTKKLLLGVPLKQNAFPVCTECKANSNVCILRHKEQICMGSVIRGGCEAVCPSFGDPCIGCRGFVDHANFPGFAKILRDSGYDRQQIINSFSYFNGTKTLSEYLESYGGYLE